MKNLSHKDIVLLFSPLKVRDINGLRSFIYRIFLFVISLFVSLSHQYYFSTGYLLVLVTFFNTLRRSVLKN